MGRRKTVAQLQKQLEYAQRRETYKPPTRNAGAATQRRPTVKMQYSSYVLGEDFGVNVSRASATFFGGASALGLEEAVTAPNAPRGFEPAKVHAMIGDGSPTTAKAKATGRTYIKYSRGAVGSGVQSTFSAPISDQATPTAIGVRTRYRNIFNAQKGDLGGAYGRMWMTWEQAPMAESGD